MSLWTDGPTSLVMSASAPGTHDCWSILDLKAVPSSAVWGISGMGTYYALDAGVAASDCVVNGKTPTTCTVTGPRQWLP